MHGESLTLADLWGEQRACELISRLHEARAVQMKFQVLEEWLLLVASKPLRHHPAVDFALKEFQKDSQLLSSAGMSDRVGYSQRHFIQVFQDEVGMAPKLFCRVLRFQKVIKTIRKMEAVDWTDVALSCGYFDQSHFNHDFREFSGLTPTEYLKVRMDHLNHVKVP
jgi:AraC-like DNA-binding protein